MRPDGTSSHSMRMPTPIAAIPRRREQHDAGRPLESEHDHGGVRARRADEDHRVVEAAQDPTVARGPRRVVHAADVSIAVTQMP